MLHKFIKILLVKISLACTIPESSLYASYADNSSPIGFSDAINVLYYSLGYMDLSSSLAQKIAVCADFNNDEEITFNDFLNVLYHTLGYNSLPDHLVTSPPPPPAPSPPYTSPSQTNPFTLHFGFTLNRLFDIENDDLLDVPRKAKEAGFTDLEGWMCASGVFRTLTTRTDLTPAPTSAPVASLYLRQPQIDHFLSQLNKYDITMSSLYIRDSGFFGELAGNVLTDASSDCPSEALECRIKYIEDQSPEWVHAGVKFVKFYIGGANEWPDLSDAAFIKDIVAPRLINMGNKINTLTNGTVTLLYEPGSNGVKNSEQMIQLHNIIEEQGMSHVIAAQIVPSKFQSDHATNTINTMGIAQSLLLKQTEPYGAEYSFTNDFSTTEFNIKEVIDSYYSENRLTNVLIEHMDPSNVDLLPEPKFDNAFVEFKKIREYIQDL